MQKLLGAGLLFLLCSSCFDREIKIGVQPYAGVDNALIDTVKTTLEDTYDASVIILPEKPLPENAFINIKSPRYRADSLLKDLKRNKPAGTDHLLGMTHSDISTTKRDKDRKILTPEYKYRDWGIFGLGYKPGPSCIVSTYRLQHPNKDIFISRVKKVSIHEIGHNLGLDHCETADCVMRDAVEKIQTIDSVGYGLCSKCKTKI